MQPVTLARGKTVSIGSGTYINSNLTLVDDYEITIGENCLIAFGNPCRVVREITDRDKEYYYHDLRVDAQK